VENVSANLLKVEYFFLLTELSWGTVSLEFDLRTQIGNVPQYLKLLAHINLVAAERMDFSLAGPPGTKIEYLKYPNSFRATISQVRTSVSNTKYRRPGFPDF
jgi:hypothetical protein